MLPLCPSPSPLFFFGSCPSPPQLHTNKNKRKKVKKKPKRRIKRPQRPQIKTQDKKKQKKERKKIPKRDSLDGALVGAGSLKLGYQTLTSTLCLGASQCLYLKGRTSGPRNSERAQNFATNVVRLWCLSLLSSILVIGLGALFTSLFGFFHWWDLW